MFREEPQTGPILDAGTAKQERIAPLMSLLRVLLTAEEAYPVLEQRFLEAEREIRASFRVFDPATPLLSDAARKVGTTWFDLLQHTLERGVRIDLTISDFDPIARGDLHRSSHEALRRIIAAGEASGNGPLLRARVSLHPARVGFIPRMILWPKVQGQLSALAEKLNDMEPHSRRKAMAEMPRMVPWMVAMAEETTEERAQRKAKREEEKARERAARAEDGHHHLRDRIRAHLRPRRWPFPPLVPTTHHQKLAVFDRKYLYIGGLDLDERRFDTKRHDRPAEETWHDVQLLLTGEIAGHADDYLQEFRATTYGQRPTRKFPGLLRSVSSRRRCSLASMSPKPVLSELADAHYNEVQRARRLIYLESQYFRDRRLARALAQAAQRHPHLGLILILPAAPEDVAFEGNKMADARFGEYLQAWCVRRVRKAFGKRCFIGSPAQPRPAPEGLHPRAKLYGAPLIYLHAKVSIFDDQRAIVSSANLNGRSLHWDTEAGAFLDDRKDVARLRATCPAHWLPANAGEEFFDLDRAPAAWRRLAVGNSTRDPEDRRGFILPYPIQPAEKFGRMYPGVPEQMV